MNALAHAKRRASRRRSEAGIAMFIVSMMMTVLGTVGIFALAAASTEVKTSGNERQNTQTHYLSEFGVVAISHEVSGGKAQGYLGLMFSKPDQCMSLPIPSTMASSDTLGRACRRVESQELQAMGNWAMAPTVVYGGGTPATAAYQGTPTSPLTPVGSLGPVPTLPNFFIELTDPTQTGAPPRYSTDLNICFIQLTATSVGVTQPTFGGNVAYGNEGIEMQRARVIAGPVQCPR